MNGTGFLSFLLGEIPFLLFMSFLVYTFWIRPKRKEKWEAEKESAKRNLPGDRILFSDGMVGSQVKRSSSYITVSSGPDNEQFERKTADILANLSDEERQKKAFQALSLKEKILHWI